MRCSQKKEARAMVFRAGSRLIAAQAHRGGAYREPDASRTGPSPETRRNADEALLRSSSYPWHLNGFWMPCSSQVHFLWSKRRPCVPACSLSFLRYSPQGSPRCGRRIIRPSVGNSATMRVRVCRMGKSCRWIGSCLRSGATIRAPSTMRKALFPVPMAIISIVSNG